MLSWKAFFDTSVSNLVRSTATSSALANLVLSVCSLVTETGKSLAVTIQHLVQP
jgi:hypothetical protein